jgi:NACHT domain
MVRGRKRPDRRRRRAIRDYPMWLAATVAVALLALPWVVALALAPHHHLDATAVGILAAVSIPLSGLWLSWVTVAKGGGSGALATGLSTAQVADQIAVAVGKQWADEAAIRRLNDPYPLPVSWEAADTSLTDSWDSLVKLASSGAGWPAPPPAGTWAPGPGDLAGKDGDLVDVLARVPTGRLVVLGEPGAGKTMLMVRLVVDLLARRATGGPVPFLTSIASWNPVEEDLRDWLGAQLLIDHPALGIPPADRAEPTRAAALLASGLILPVLDGLDEIPEKVRGPAIGRINEALRPGEQVVVTSRIRQYRDAVRPQEGIEVTVRAAAAIELRPLDVAVVRRYLCDDAAGPVARARWDPVFAVLGTDAPAGQALRTPLMVGLARAIYNPRPGELAGALRDPAELCVPALGDQTEAESLLYDAFIPAAYRDHTAGRWTPRQAERWLVLLARHLEQTIGNPDLAWWQLNVFVSARAPARGTRISAQGLVSGIVFGLGFGFGFGFLLGFVFGPVFGLKFPDQYPWTGLTARIAHGIVPGAVFGYLGALVGGLGGGLEAKPSDLARVTSATAVLARDRKAALLYVLVSGIALGLAGGFLFGLVHELALGIVVGLVGGLVLGFGLSAARTAWPSYVLAKGWLALRHLLPWSLMDFLADAHRRGVLRQAGAVYQFRHIELQHRLATRDASSDNGRLSDTTAANALTTRLMARNGHKSTPSLVRTPRCDADSFVTMSHASTSGRRPLVRTLAVTESEHPASATTRHLAHIAE